MTEVMRLFSTRLYGRHGMAFLILLAFFYLVFWIHIRSSNVSRHSVLELNDLRLLTEQSGTQHVATPLFHLPKHVAVDDAPESSERQLVTDLERQLPNLPLLHLYDQKPSSSKNKTFGRLPTLYDIHFNNIYWQETSTSNGTFYLYGAYLDVRKSNRLGPTVRILGMIDRLEPQVKTFCLLWFKDSTQPVAAKVVEYKYIWYKTWGNYKPGIFQPYLLACQLPKSHWKQKPISVSIVEHVSDWATNNLKVIENRNENDVKKDFAVCVKGLDFPNQDLSVRLIEWIEMLSLLGADKIFLYQLEIHPNVSKVLNYYVERGVVDLTLISLPGHQPNVKLLQHMYLKTKVINKRQNELIPYNDCLYRNIYRYNYIAVIDIDEVIMPKGGDVNSWSELMKRVEASSPPPKNGQTRASFNFRNVYFMNDMLKERLKTIADADEADSQTLAVLEEIPDYMHMLRNVYRSGTYTKPGQYVKCFHKPEKVVVLHNHFPLACLGGPCTSFAVDTGVAHLQHYRDDCVKALKKSCGVYRNGSVVDTTIWKFKDKLFELTTNALLVLGFLKSDDNVAAPS